MDKERLLGEELLQYGADETDPRVQEAIGRIANTFLAGNAGFGGDMLSLIGHMRQGEDGYDNEEDAPYFSPDEVLSIARNLRDIDKQMTEENGGYGALSDFAHFAGREVPAYLLGSIVPGSPFAKALVSSASESMANSSNLYNEMVDRGVPEQDAYIAARNTALQEMPIDVIGHSLTRVAPLLGESSHWGAKARLANGIAEANQQIAADSALGDIDSLQAIKQGLLGIIY